MEARPLGVCCGRGEAAAGRAGGIGPHGTPWSFGHAAPGLVDATYRRDGKNNRQKTASVCTEAIQTQLTQTTQYGNPVTAGTYEQLSAYLT